MPLLQQHDLYLQRDMRKMQEAKMRLKILEDPKPGFDWSLIETGKPRERDLTTIAFITFLILLMTPTMVLAHSMWPGWNSFTHHKFSETEGGNCLAMNSSLQVCMVIAEGKCIVKDTYVPCTEDCKNLFRSYGYKVPN